MRTIVYLIQKALSNPDTRYCVIAPNSRFLQQVAWREVMQQLDEEALDSIRPSRRIKLRNGSEIYFVSEHNIKYDTAGLSVDGAYSYNELFERAKEYVERTTVHKKGWFYNGEPLAEIKTASV